MNVSSRNL
jgi:hypothetical protein